jgi:NADH-quinone oxidoreductase subunit L
MWLPLILLAVLAAVGGVVNLPWGQANFLERWLAPVVGPFSVVHGISSTGKVVSAVVTTALVIVAIVAAFRVWSRSPAHERLEPTALRRAWFVDDTIYPALVERPGEALADLSAGPIDQGIIDGAVNGVAAVVRTTGRQVRRLQTGYVRNYAVGIAAGSVAVLAFILARAT